METIVPSITRSDKIAYRISNDLYRGNLRFLPHLHIAPWACEYETYGHGLTAHGPDYYVCNENMTDFLISVAHAMTNGENKVTATTIVMQECPSPCDPSKKKIDSARSIKYKESDRYRYYHKDTFKVSKSNNKQHDRRWEQITEWMNGSTTATQALVMESGGWTGQLWCLICLAAVLEAKEGNEGWQAYDLKSLYREDHQSKSIDYYYLKAAYLAFRHAMITVHYKNHIEHTITTFINNDKNRREKAEQTA